MPSLETTRVVQAVTKKGEHNPIVRPEKEILPCLGRVPRGMQLGFQEPLENPSEPCNQKPSGIDGGSGAAAEFTAAPHSIACRRRTENLGMNVSV